MKKNSYGINLDYNRVLSCISDVKAVDKISPEERAAAELHSKANNKRRKEPMQTSQSASVKEVEKNALAGREDSGSNKSEKETVVQVKTKERLEEIVETLRACRNDRRGSGFTAVARVFTVWNEEGKTFPRVYWFTNESFNFNFNFKFPKLAKYGTFQPKNSDIALQIQMSDLGQSFKLPYLKYAKHTVVSDVFLENRSNLQDQTINIAGDGLTYQYRDFDEFLEELQKNHDDIVEVESTLQKLKAEREELKKHAGTSQEQAKKTRKITDLERQYRILTMQQEDLRNLSIYIRNQGEMRYVLYVDHIQTRAKTQNLFDGKTLIIEGGPGTGKSTTMIQRLAYLTDTYAIDEDERNKNNKYHLTTKQRDKLRKAIKSQRDWIFFSPSELLKNYLADAMNKEGLEKTSEKVWHWEEYREMILQKHYQILEGSDGYAPFMVSCLDEHAALFYNSDIIKEFKNFYLGQLRDIKNKLPQLKTEGTVYAWTAIAQNIKSRFEDSEKYSLYQFITLFNSLDSVYGNDYRKFLRERNETVNELSNEIYNLLEENEKVMYAIADIIDFPSDTEEAIEDDEEMEEILNEESPLASTANRITMWMKSVISKKQENPKNEKLFSEIQKWLKAYCKSKNDNNTPLSDLHELMSDELLPLMRNDFDKQIDKICEMMTFEQFGQYTRGVKNIMLNGLPAKYRKFRSHLISTQFEGCNLILLRDIMRQSQGKELHHQEQSLLLGFINELVKQILSSNLNVKHTYIEAYNEVARPIIGIDEATDFSACDIYAMQSLLSWDYYSLTLCGDRMQRMTEYGIKSWSDLKDIVPNYTAPVQLSKSYRQSKKLLEVAKKISIDTMNNLDEVPDYKAFIKFNKVPDPLAYISDNESYKINWISKRIEEVHRAYGGKLPSVAIFVNDKYTVPRFIEKLKLTDFFNNSGIEIIDGLEEKKGVKDKYISVYPIDVVKGMEFDVVFFHDIDHTPADKETLRRYIYVGISRAAFFLGITLSKDDPEISKYFIQNKDWFKI